MQLHHDGRVWALAGRAQAFAHNGLRLQSQRPGSLLPGPAPLNIHGFDGLPEGHTKVHARSGELGGTGAPMLKQSVQDGVAVYGTGRSKMIPNRPHQVTCIN